MVELIDPATTVPDTSGERPTDRLKLFWEPSEADRAAVLPGLPAAPEYRPVAPPGQATKRFQERKQEAAVKADPYGRDPELMEDFRNFLCIIWEFLGLPAPSAVQLSLAYWLQHGPDRAVILGFRGMAKSWITGAFILWTLYCDPQQKVMVASASLDRAVQTVQWCLALIREMPELRFLLPGPNQRASGKQFDVGPATPDQSPSIKGVGISGQLAGSRAHLIVPDDVEIPSNSMTTVMREKIADAVKEFDAILHPGGKVKFLGTPQCEDSLYPKLTKRGYTMRIWTARFPDPKMVRKYGDRLAPWIIARLEKDPTLVGHSVWPSRFSDADLQNRELSYGRSGFALQFMLDTSLSDADRYPLKLRDFIVYALDPTLGPDVIAWGNDPKLVLNELPVLGFEGDRYYGPASKSETVSPYNSIIAWCDPSGRGTDETGLAIVAELHGRLFVLHCSGWRDGYAPATLTAIAEALVQFNVQKLWIEDNYGDGMFTALLAPYIVKAWDKHNVGKADQFRGGTSTEGIRSPKVQKELRILGVLEPATQQHRVVVSTQVIEADYKGVQTIGESVGEENKGHYSLFHQFSHLTRDRDSLLHDDKLETLAGAISTFSNLLGIDPWVASAEKDTDRMLEELDALMAEVDDITENQQGHTKWHRGVSAVRPD